MVRKFTTGIVAFGLLAGALITHAANCTIQQSDFAKLQAIQNDPTLSTSDEIKSELDLRKEMLKTAVGCAVTEATDLKQRINNTVVDDQSAITLRATLSNELDNAINYYLNQESTIDGLGLQGSKNFAADLENWRRGNYTDVAEKTNNFLIWVSNQALFDAAGNRINQLGQTVTLLKLAYVEDVQTLWNGTDEQFKEAQKLNSQSINDLANAPPDQSIGTMQASLSALSKTYLNLADLVSAINQELALPNQ